MEVVVRAAILFAVLFLVTRLAGRRELGDLEPFDLILLVTIGDLVQQGITQDDFSATGAVLAVATILLLTVAVSYASFRFPLLRPALEGRPVVVIADGEIVEGNLKRHRISIDELRAQARLQQIGSLDQVAWGILESNGRLSFVPRVDPGR